jgi:hypothetical protein
MRRPFVYLPNEVERRKRMNLLARAGFRPPPSRERLVEWVTRDLSYRRELIIAIDTEHGKFAGAVDDLHEFSYIVYLDPPFEYLWERLCRRQKLNGDRPLDREAVHTDWLEYRRLYSNADLLITNETSDTVYLSKLAAHCFFT